MNSIDIHGVAEAKGRATNHNDSYIVVAIDVVTSKRAKTVVRFYSEDLAGIKEIRLALQEALGELENAIENIENHKEESAQ